MEGHPGTSEISLGLVERGFQDFMGCLETKKWCPEPGSNRHNRKVERF